MDNFYILPLEHKNIDSCDFLYSEDYILVGKKLCFDDKIIELKDKINYFISYKYDFLFVNSENDFYTINKYTQEKNEIGKIASKILGISKSKCEKYTVIITDKDILLFNTYFELIKEKDFEFKNFVHVGWAGNSTFFVVSKESLYFFDEELNLVGSNKDYGFRYVGYRDKYNIFLASTNKGIIPIESNGLIHGEVIDIECTKLGFINDDILYTFDSSSGILKILYSKNFYWYTKQSIKIFQDPIDCKGNVLIFRKDSIISHYIVMREVCNSKNNFLVIDDNNVLYSNFGRYKIPPPFYLSKVELDQSIRHISILNNTFVVLLKQKIIYFKIEDDLKLKPFKNVILSDEFDCCTLFSNYLFLVRKNNILIKLTLNNLYNGEKILTLGDLVNQNTIIIVNKDRIECYRRTEFLNLNLRIVKIYNFDEVPTVLFSNGYVLYHNFYFNLQIDFTKNFRIYINDLDRIVYFLHNSNLSITKFKIDTYTRDSKVYETSKEKGEKTFTMSLKCKNDLGIMEEIKIESFNIKNVYSFIESDIFFAWNNNDLINILTEGKEYTAFLDPNFNLLGSTNLEIFGETRQGTLETFFPKAFSNIWIKKLILEEKYSEAMIIAYKYGISVSMFFHEKINMEKFVRCNNKYILSFVDEMIKIFSDFSIILDSEILQALRELFYNNLAKNELEIDLSNVKLSCIHKYYIFRTKLLEEIYLKYKNVFDTQKLMDDFINQSPVVEKLKFNEMIEKIKLSSYYTEALLCSSAHTKEKRNIDFRDKVKFLNAFLSHLDQNTHFEIILYILIKFKRTDLAIKFSLINLEKGIRYLLTITTLEDIRKSVISLFDSQLITDVYRIIQKDSSDILAFINKLKENELRYKLCDLIEDRKNALFYFHIHSNIILDESFTLEDIDIGFKEDLYSIINKLPLDSKNKLSKDEEGYIKKYKLFKEVLFLSKMKIRDEKEKLYLELYALNTNFEKAKNILKSINFKRRLLILYFMNDKYEEAFEELKNYPTEIKTKLSLIFIKKMKNKYKDIGIIFEKYLDNKDEAMLNYIKGKSFADIIRLYDERYLQQVTNYSINFMRNDLIALDNLMSKYRKYKDRFKVIEDRGDEFMSEATSFNYTVTSYKTRGRPGGIYEKEFVLEKLRDIGVDVCYWRDNAEDLLGMFRKINRNDCIENMCEHFSKIKKEIKVEYDRFFENNDYFVFDPNRPKIEKPDLSRWFK